MPGAVPWLRFNPKLLYVDELEFVFYLLFIDVTEERHVVPFDFLYSFVWLYGTVGLPKAVLLHSCLNGGLGRFPDFLLSVHIGKHEQKEVQRPCTDVGFVLIRESVP